METTSTNPDRVLDELERVLTSRAFRGAERSSAVLRYLVEQVVAGRGERLKEYTVGVEALGRGESADPRTDPIVRAEASRLRGRLERYYESEGSDDETVIALPKGSYVPGLDDTIIANLNGRAALWRVPAAGGTPILIADFSADGVSPRWPQLLPGGTDVLFSAVRSIAADRATIDVLSLRTGKRKTLVSGGTFGRYLSPGVLAYVNQWTALRLADTGVMPNYDLAADGRVLALVPKSALGQDQREHQATVVFGFFDELRRRVAPVRR